MQVFQSGRFFALTAVALAAHSYVAAQTTETVLNETTVRATAEEELKQALGVSTITQEELSKRPPPMTFQSWCGRCPV